LSNQKSHLAEVPHEKIGMTICDDALKDKTAPALAGAVLSALSQIARNVDAAPRTAPPAPLPDLQAQICPPQRGLRLPQLDRRLAAGD
jgi:hypothetical protein